MTAELFRGTCDASAAVRLANTEQFVTASDEDFILRLYDHRQPGLPTISFDVAPFLEPRDPTKEPDIEGAAQVGDRIYWISPHGRDKDGEEQESRQRLFAMSIAHAGAQIAARASWQTLQAAARRSHKGLGLG